VSRAADRAADTSQAAEPTEQTAARAIPDHKSEHQTFTAENIGDSALNGDGLQGGSQPSAPNARDGRDGGGRFLPGNIAALRHGARSQRPGAELYPEAAAALRATEDAILSELGGAGVVSTTRRELVTQFVRATAVAEVLAQDFIAHGVVTSKGHTRRSVATWLQVIDRAHRLAGAIGLERQAKPVGFAEFITRG